MCPKKTIHQIFEESCAQYADRPFTDFLDKVMTFRDYKDATDRAAAGFQKLGVGPGVNVGLYLPNTPHYLIAFFGVLKAGGRVVNYCPLDAARELEFKIGDSETDILVTLDVAALYPKMAAMRGKTRLKKLIVGSIADYLPWPKNWLYPIAKKKEISAWPRDDWHMSFKDLLKNDGKYTSHPAPDNLWDEVALLQYTGGTTGLPKAAMLTHGCVVSAMTQGQSLDDALHHARQREGRLRAAAVPHLRACRESCWARCAERQPADPLSAARHRHDRRPTWRRRSRPSCPACRRSTPRSTSIPRRRGST